MFVPDGLVDDAGIGGVAGDADDDESGEGEGNINDNDDGESDENDGDGDGETRTKTAEVKGVATCQARYLSFIRAYTLYFTELYHKRKRSFIPRQPDPMFGFGGQPYPPVPDLRSGVPTR